MVHEINKETKVNKDNKGIQVDLLITLDITDSIYFDATEPHNPRNIGDTEAQLLVLYIFNAPK